MAGVDVAVDAVDDADDFVHPMFRLAPGEDAETDTSRLYRYQAEIASQKHRHVQLSFILAGLGGSLVLIAGYIA
ncbi:hypothetical protein [Streptomyces sp. R33]|uniref:Uncharacterized protein n=1 Tax=Streptomyces sp. R33 TaxID=3238629 RepID=A0AB39YFZ5_9ACTN